jgi:hypothetical protein
MEAAMGDNPPGDAHPRSLGARVGKAVVTVVIVAALGGLFFSLGPWFYYLKSSRYSKRYDASKEIVSGDTWASMKRRFWWGAGAGAAVGLLIAYALSSEAPEGAKEEGASDEESSAPPPGAEK